MDKTGNWRLSPAFDVCHSFRPGSAWVSQQSLSVNGKRQNITRDDFLLVGRQMNIKKAPQIIVRVNASVKKWNQYAEVNAKLRDAIYSTLIYFGQ
jgi:serine/threonine-protein kinase HipA